MFVYGFQFASSILCIYIYYLSLKHRYYNVVVAVGRDSRGLRGLMHVIFFNKLRKYINVRLM